MAARNLAFKMLSLLVIFVLLFSNSAVVLAQQPDPATPTPSAAQSTATPAVSPAAPTPAAPAQASTSLTISGKVTGKDGQPLAGVPVADEHGNSTTTGGDGTYALPGLQPGAYVVAPKLEGQIFLPYYRVVKLVDKDAGGVDFYVPQSNPDAVHANPNQPAGAPAFQPHPPSGQPSQPVNPTQGGISSQAVYTPGAAGLVYRYAGQKGVTGKPYPVQADDAITYLNGPVGVALDHNNNLLVAEEAGSRVVRFDPAGTSNLSIGEAGVRYTDDTGSVFSRLLGTAEQPVAHTIWAADNSRLVEYSAGGNFIMNFPTDQPWNTGSGPDRFDGARGIAFNDDGTQMYVADTYNNRVQVFSLANDGSVQTPTLLNTIYGTAAGGLGNPFNNPWHLTYYNGFVYVADLWNNRIQKCDPNDGTCTPLDLYGAVITDKSLDLPTSIAFGTIDSTAYAFISDARNQRVLRCDADGTNCLNLAGTAGEPGSDANHFFWPEDVSVGTDGRVYVADKFNHVVQVFDGGTTDRLGERGTLRHPYQTDASHLNTPYGIAVVPGTGPKTGFYVAEQMGLTLVKFDNSGTFQWRAGEPGSPGMGSFTWWSGEPEYTGGDVDHFSSVGIDGPLGVDSKGRIYVPDISNYRIVIYLPDGTVFTTMGDGWGNDNYHFDCPTAVAINPANDDIYVADSCNARVQVYDSQRQYKGTLGVTGEQGNDSQHFAWPHGLAVDASGNVFVADQNNMRVQKCKLSGSSYTCVPFAGATGAGGVDFRFTNGPVGIAIGPQDGLIYVVEQWQNRVDVFDPSGAYRTTLGGNWGDGTGNLRSPGGIAVDSSNNVWVADTTNQRVVKYGRGVPGWSQLNVNGWGEQVNDRASGFVAYPTDATTGQMLYTVTEPSSSSGISPQVWRMLPDQSWQAVSTPGFGDAKNISLVNMKAFNGGLYVSTWNQEEGAQIWACSQASGCDQPSDWQNESAHGLSLDYKNGGIGSLQVYNGKLYAGTFNWFDNGSGTWITEGAQLWSFDGAPTSTWHEDQQFSAAVTHTLALPMISEMTVFNNELVIGFANWIGGGSELWTLNTNSASPVWTQRESGGITTTDNTAFSSLHVFGANLYVGTNNSVDHAMIYRFSTDYSTLAEKVVPHGFGQLGNDNIRAMTDGGGNIYAVVQNTVTGLQIWCSSSGDFGSWSRCLANDGFGNSNNQLVDTDSSVIFWNSRLFVGAQNAINGGGVWASDPITPYTISGIITPTSGPLPDSIVVTLQPGGLTTYPAGSAPGASAPSAQVAAGFYSFTNLGAGSYTVTPARAGCTFTPTLPFTNPIVLLSSSFTTANFSVACTPINLLSPADGTQLNSLDAVTLSWSPVAGATSATKYTLTVSTSPSFANTFKSATQATTSYVLSGLVNGAVYYWRVKSTAPVAGPSVGWKITAPIPPAAPALLNPANASTLVTGNLRPVFTWKAAAVPTGGKPVEHYHLQIAQKNTFDSLDLDEYTKDASLTYTMPFDLTPNRVYYWRMRAFNTSAGYSKWSSVYSFKTLPGPVGLDWVENRDTLLMPTFHWHDDWKTGKYTIQICKRTSSTVCSLFKSATLTDLSYTLTTSLAPNTLYNWRVQAVGTAGAGPWTDYGSWTTPTPPAVPTPVWPAANAILPDLTHPGYLPTLDWSDVTGTGISYVLQVSTDPGFFDWSTFTYDNTTDSFQTVNELMRNQVYYWRVHSCNSGGACSVWTTARKLTTKPDVPVSTGQNQIDQTGVYGFYWSDKNQNSAGKYTIQICNNATCSSIFKSATVTNSWEYQLLLPSYKDIWWRVQGVGITTGNWMDPPEYFKSVVTPGVPVLSTPGANALVTLPMSNPPNIMFIWQAVTDANQYEIQIAYNTTSFNAPDVDQVVGVTNAKALAYGTSYWRVRASNTAGNWGQWSAVRKFLVKPAVGGYIETWNTDGAPLPLSGASVSMTGNISSILKSDGTGLYYMPPNLPLGVKTLVASKTDYLPQTRTLNLANGGNYLPTNFWLAPVNPDSSVYRFVLSWDSPVAYRDLDLHAWLPGTNPAHIFWGNTGTLAAFPYAQLSTLDITPTVEVLDIGQMQPGKYVIGANQYYPDSGPWSGANVKVDVFKGSDLQKSCLAPSGTGLWWYVMDVTVTGSIPVFTCKNKVQAGIPVTTLDQTISGTIKQLNGHAVQDVLMNYGEGSANVGSPYTLSGLGNGNHTLTPSKTTGTSAWTFTPPSQEVPIGTEDADFTANPPPALMVGGAPQVVAAQGDYLYVGGGGKLYIVNVQDKANPIVVSSFWIATDPIVDIAVQGNYAYVAEWSSAPGGSSALDIVDISDPTHPAIVSTYVGTVKTVTVSGYYAYLTSGMDFIILDVHNPAKPSVVKDYYWDTAAANRVLVKDNYAYVGGENGVWIFNVTDPSNPSYVSNWSSESGDPIVGIAWNNGHLVVTDTASLYTLNIDNPSYPGQDLKTDLPYGGTAYQTTAVGNTLYVADGANGLLIYDISEPWNDITQLGFLIPPDGTEVVAAQDNYAYVIDAEDVLFVNASRRDDPAPAGSYTPAP